MSDQNYYKNYKAIIFDEGFNENTKGLKMSILEKGNAIFEDFNKYLAENVPNHFDFINKFDDAKKQEITESLTVALVSGIDLFISVALANALPLKLAATDAEDENNIDGEKLNEDIQNEEKRNEILGNYDVYPIIQEMSDIFFYNLVETTPDLVEYRYEDVENFKNYYGYIVENSYVICHSLFV